MGGVVHTASGRHAAAVSLGRVACSFPRLGGPVLPGTENLAPREASLALAIHRVALQRWLTLEFFLDLNLRKSVRLLEPALQGVLMSGAAQILFLDRLPVHAVVDQSVRIARSLVRPGAAGLVNAVLRRLSEQIQPSVVDQPWAPAADRLPLDSGSLRLRRGLLPDPGLFEDHMAVATSHPQTLIRRWVRTYGTHRTRDICWHGIQRPPIVVAMEPGVRAGPGGVDARVLQPHAWPGYFLWRGDYDELVRMLRQHPARRAQDPASGRPVEATARLRPAWCVDYCAGRGTKTRQIAWMHSEARLVAADRSSARLADLRHAFQGHPNVTVVRADEVAGACPAGGVDLLVLDVPCSNTGTLARRPEARYRFSDDTLKSLVSLQRRIVESAVPLARSGGHVLYSTCSLEEEENRGQTRWIVGRYGAAVLDESDTLPAGTGAAYHDGGYHALLRMP